MCHLNKLILCMFVVCLTNGLLAAIVIKKKKILKKKKGRYTTNVVVVARSIPDPPIVPLLNGQDVNVNIRRLSVRRSKTNHVPV